MLFPDSFDSTLDVCGINLNKFEKKFIKKYLFFMKIDLRTVNLGEMKNPHDCVPEVNDFYSKSNAKSM